MLTFEDYQKCVFCGTCEEECEQGVIFNKENGYKVIVGGTGARHPHIEETVAEFTDADGVLKILEKAVIIFKETSVDGIIISLRDVIRKHGIEKFKI